MHSAEKLYRKGFVVLPTKFAETQAQRETLRENIRRDMRNAPELRQPIHFTDETQAFVGGGFGALGNPSSFHMPSVRYLREWSMWYVLPVLAKLLDYMNVKDPHKYRLEQIIDRLMLRPLGASAPSDAWHRDVAKVPNVCEDKTFGGWLNLDDRAQTFLCAPGTHHLNDEELRKLRQGKGFGPIPKNEHSKFKRIQETQGGKVTIPPGHILLFFEHLAHEVVSKKATQRMYRLFLGWRLTKDKNPLFPIDFLKTQGIARIKSAQLPRMYPKLYWTNHRTKLETLSSQLVHMDVLIRKRVETGLKAGTEHVIMPDIMPSLSEMRMPLWPAYGVFERGLYTPSKAFNVLKPGSTKHRKPLRLHDHRDGRNKNQRGTQEDPICVD